MNEELPKTEHGECCEECKKTCKRNFWTEVLRTIVRVGTAVLAAFGLANAAPTNLPPDGGGILPWSSD